MVFPVSDDNTGRTRTPYVTYLLIALNVLVFVFLQGMGTNEQFTYAFSVVPEEIRTGEDIARRVSVQVGDDSATHPSTAHTRSRLPHAADLDVHAWQLHASVRQHALPVDLRRQRGGRSRAGPVYWVLSGDRAARVARARGDDVHARGQSLHPESWRLGSHFRSPRRVSRAAPAPARARPHVAHDDGGARVCRRWNVVRLPADQRVWRDRPGPQSGGGVAFMAHIGGFVAGVALVKVFGAGATKPPLRRLVLA